MYQIAGVSSSSTPSVFPAPTQNGSSVGVSLPSSVLLSALAYTLVERLRALALKDMSLAHAQVATLRDQLLKLAAFITRNTRRIRLYFASHWPSAAIFQQAVPYLEQRIILPGAAARRDDANQAGHPNQGGGCLAANLVRQSKSNKSAHPTYKNTSYFVSKLMRGR